MKLRDELYNYLGNDKITTDEILEMVREEVHRVANTNNYMNLYGVPDLVKDIQEALK